MITQDLINGLLFVIYFFSQHDLEKAQISKLKLRPEKLPAPRVSGNWAPLQTFPPNKRDDEA